MSSQAPEDVIKNVLQVNEILNSKIGSVTALVKSLQENFQSVLKSTQPDLESVSSILKSPDVLAAQSIITDLASTVETLPSLISENIGSLPLKISGLVKNLPSILANSLPSGLPGLSAISSMAQSLPSSIMSALPQALTGGAGGLPSLVSTLPSQLSSLIPSLPSGLSSLIPSGLASGLPGLSSLIPSGLASGLPGLSAISSMAQSLPSSIMSSLPQALTGGGGGLPSLVSTLPSQLSSLIPSGLPSGLSSLIPSGLPGLSAISSLAQSLPSSIMSALPQALTGGGGGLPSLVSTLPSQLTRFLPGGLGSVRGLGESMKYQQEAIQAHMPKVLSSLLSARGISPADRSVQTLAPRLALAGAASQLQKSADSPATESVLPDKLDGAYDFNVRSFDFDSDHILDESQNQESAGEELDKIKEGLEIILAKEFDRHAVVNGSPSQVAKGEVHDPFNEENLANLKRNFEEILIREFRRYGGEIS